MKKFVWIIFVLLAGCAMQNPLTDMRFQTVTAPPYILSTWYKIEAPGESVKFYIEDFGDQHNPNPKDEKVRKKAAADKSPNVVYLALPCQYGMTAGCDKPAKDADVVKSLNMAVESMMKKARTKQAVFIGFGVGEKYATELAKKY